MQVIHRYHGFYPFQLQGQSQQTYLQVLIDNLSEQQISTYRKRYKNIKGVDHANLIKLAKIYKEQSKLHLLYEYFPLSLEKYIQYRSQNLKEGEKDQYKVIYSQFVAVITNIVEVFVKFQIKTEIIIQNFAVNDLKSGILKLFVDPLAEFIGQSDQNETREQEIKLNKLFLQEFYMAEKKRIAMEFQELLEKYLGKKIVSEFNRPNFIINGSKLVFINSNDRKNLGLQRKIQNVNQLVNEKERDKKQTVKLIHGNSPVKTQKSQLKRDLKEKTLKKLTEIKGVLNRFDVKPLPQNDQQQYSKYPQEKDQVVFRSDERTNDKTPVLEENQYLQSIENQMERINDTKKERQQRQSQEKRTQIIKQISQLQQKNKKHSEMLPNQSKGQYQAQRYDENKTSDRFRDSKSNTNLDKCNIKYEGNSAKNDSKYIDRQVYFVSNQQAPTKLEERRDQRPNKYKMKIITSHQIQIQGASEPQVREAQKEILQNIKSGKMNLTQFSLKRQERPKTVKAEGEEPNRLQERIAKDTENAKINSRNSDIASKSRKINEIIEKINSKSNINNNNQLSNSSHHTQQKTESTQTLSSYKSNVQTVEYPQENYVDKIREAKNKAQQVLKQYAKKKQ